MEKRISQYKGFSFFVDLQLADSLSNSAMLDEPFSGFWFLLPLQEVSVLLSEQFVVEFPNVLQAKWG